MTARFEAMRTAGRCGAIAYLTCGDPDLMTTIETALALEQAGADIIELGVPFSDPVADGPVIQEASQHALRNGVRLSDVLATAASIRRQSDIPLVLFSYLNPLMRFGFNRLAAEAADAGMDAVIAVDLPVNESADLREALQQRGLGLVQLAAPSTAPKRLLELDRASDGFLYCVSTAGVTGERSELASGLVERLESIRSLTSKPLAVGFGVSTADHFSSLAPHCDAVVVGSAIVRAIRAGDAAGAAQRAAGVLAEITGHRFSPAATLAVPS